MKLVNDEYVVDPASEIKTLEHQKEREKTRELRSTTGAWAAYSSIVVAKHEALPSKHHCFLFQPLVAGFALDGKTWSRFFYMKNYFKLVMCKHA